MNDIYRKRMTLKITNTTHVYEVLHAMSDYYNKKGRKVNVICDLIHTQRYSYGKRKCIYDFKSIF